MAEAYQKIRTERAPAPSGGPVNHGFSAFFTEKLGYLVLKRMEDVSAVFRNPDTFSAENVQDPMLPICDAAAEILSSGDFNPIAVMSNRARPDHNPHPQIHPGRIFPPPDTFARTFHPRTLQHHGRRHAGHRHSGRIRCVPRSSVARPVSRILPELHFPARAGVMA